MTSYAHAARRPPGRRPRGGWLAGAGRFGASAGRTLIVLLRPGDAPATDGADGTVAADSADTRALPFAVLDRKGEPERSGWASFDELPKTDATVLVVAARDTLLLNVSLPPVSGPRLERLLPNIVEEHLIHDAQRSHIALDPEPLVSGERCVAVLNREWFAGVIERFGVAGHRGLRAVPLTRCIPIREVGAGSEPTLSAVSVDEALATNANALGSEAVEEPGTDAVQDADRTPVPAAAAATAVLVFGYQRFDALATTTPDEDAGWVELAVRQGALGYGVSVRAAELTATLAGIAEGGQLAVHDLAMDEDSNPAPGAPHAAARTPGIESLRWEVVAREALACRFNLCQFAFSRAGRAGLGRGGLRHWRTALGLVGAAALVSIVAVNVQWFQLRHRRDAINAEMTSLVKASFPGAPIVLDPHAQMALGLKRLAQADGELRPDDFLTLAAALARALPPVASTALAGLDYSDGAFDVTFKPGTEIDEEGLKRRLAAQGLSAQEENGKWTLKSARPGPH